MIHHLSCPPHTRPRERQWSLPTGFHSSPLYGVTPYNHLFSGFPSVLISRSNTTSMNNLNLHLCWHEDVVIAGRGLLHSCKHALLYIITCLQWTNKAVWCLQANTEALGLYSHKVRLWSVSHHPTKLSFPQLKEAGCFRFTALNLMVLFDSVLLSVPIQLQHAAVFSRGS